MNFLKKIFDNEDTAYIGLCKFKTLKQPIEKNNVKFGAKKEYFVTDFSANILL